MIFHRQPGHKDPGKFMKCQDSCHTRVAVGCRCEKLKYKSIGINSPGISERDVHLDLSILERASFLKRLKVRYDLGFFSFGQNNMFFFRIFLLQVTNLGEMMIDFTDLLFSRCAMHGLFTYSR